MSQSGLHQGVSDAKKKKIKRGASTWNVLMMLTPATPGNALWVARVKRHWLVCEPSRQSALSEPRLVQVRAHLLPVRRLAPAGTLVDRYRRRSSTRTRRRRSGVARPQQLRHRHLRWRHARKRDHRQPLLSRRLVGGQPLGPLRPSRLGLARLPGDVLLAGLMAAYTKNGIFASLFILHSVSAAPKPWY